MSPPPTRAAASDRVTPSRTPGLRVLRGAFRRPCRPPPIRDAEWLELVPVFGDERFRKPVQALPHPTRAGVWLVVESEGLVLAVSEDDSEPEVVLDIRDRVRAGRQWGLQSIALAPEYPNAPFLFASYTAPPADAESALESRVSRFLLRDDGTTFDAESEVVLLAEMQPTVWHPIAGLRFGPDGMLYVAWGAGGRRREPRALRGNLLRIDATSTPEAGYVIPTDNPFPDGPHRPEVFAAGFRNPWRFSFDFETDDLWLADVGGREFEEVSRVAAGEHHGWPWFEGFACRRPVGCDPEHTPPTLVHASSSLCAVIGGHVYRGTAIPALRGKYVYGDYCTRTLHAYDPESGERTFLQRLPMRFLVGIEVGPDGELYVVEAQGRPPDELERTYGVYRVRPTSEPPDPVMAGDHTITSLGCEGSRGPTSTPAQMLAYDVTLPAWHGGAVARRFVQRGFRAIGRADGVGTRRPKVFLKTLFLGSSPIETQMLAVDRAGTWGAWSFAWDDDGETAHLVTTPTRRRFPSGREWRFDTEETCFRCHSEAAGRTLGLSLRQLDVDNQLEEWLEAGILESLRPARTLRARLARLPRLVSIEDSAAGVEAKARSFLHVRCSPCHRPGGEGRPAAMDLTIDAPLDRMGICGVAPIAHYPGLTFDSLVEPGKPDASLLLLRMADGGALAMPPGESHPDVAGLEIVRSWIADLESCAPRDHSSSEK